MSLRLVHKLFYEIDELHHENKRIIRILNNLLEEFQYMSEAFDALVAQVAKNTEVEASAIEMIKSLADQIAGVKEDPVAVQALTDKLHDSAEALAAAIAANTPAAPAPVEPPVEEQPQG